MRVGMPFAGGIGQTRYEPAMRRLFKCLDRYIRELYHVVLCTCWTTDPASDDVGSKRNNVQLNLRGMVAGLWACLTCLS